MVHSMNKNSNIKEFYTVKELADFVGVSASTIRRWSRDGLIHDHRTLQGHRRFSHKEALRIVANRGDREVA